MHTLAALLADLHLDDDGLLLAGAPSGSDWILVVDALRDPAWIDGRLAATLAHADGVHRVAASYQASWLAHALVVPVARAVTRFERAWPLDPSRLWLRPTDGGWYDGLAIDAGLVTTGPVPGGALHDRVAADVVALLTPFYAALDRASGLGTPCMWGALADAIGFGCVEDAQARGSDVARTFDGATELIAAIARRTRLPRVRPKLIELSLPDGRPRHAIRRGTCCLWYRTQPDPDPCGEGFCEGCPRRDLEDQRRRWLVASG